MERKQASFEQSEEKLTAPVGNSFPVTEDTAIEGVLLSRWPEIARIYASADDKGAAATSLTDQALSTLQLDMLEAELRNQHILPPLSTDYSSLTQLVERDCSVLRWHARRMRMNHLSLGFKVNLKNYLIQVASEVAYSLHERETGSTISRTRLPSHIASSSPQDPESQMNFFERLAAFLNGNFDREPTNRYQRGLSLILKVLSDNRRAIRAVALHDDKRFSLTKLHEASARVSEHPYHLETLLPVSAREFTAILREAKAALPQLAE